MAYLNLKIKLKTFFTVFISILLIFSNCTVNVNATVGDNKPKCIMHFINVGNGDAILLESNGHFAMVDVGEDTNYPDGSDPRYPLRPGITTNEGYEDKVINYLKSNGVKKLDFVIATHSHSDHIGSMPNILDAFKVEKLYAKVYSDEYIYDESRLWDNQYVYDRMIEAAIRNNVPLIQDLNTENTKFNFNGVNIEIFNWEDKLNPDGTRKLLYDENEESLGIKLTCGNQVVFLSGDIQNTTGDEDKLAPMIGKVDLLKIGHHGLGDNFSKNFLKTLSPKLVVNSGVFCSFSPKKLKALKNIEATVLVTESFEQAIVIAVWDNEIKIMNNDHLQYNAADGNWYCYENGVKVENKFKNIYYRFNFEKYYFGEDGKAAKDGFFELNGNTYYANNTGVLRRGWVQVKNKWYYMNNEGIMQRGLISVGPDKYYLNNKGILQTGFVEINGEEYYFDLESGAMKVI